MIIKLDGSGGGSMSINTSLNYLVEALTYLSQGVNGKNAKVILDGLCRRFSDFSEEFTQRIQPIAELESYLDAHTDTPVDRLDFYFKDFNRMTGNMTSESVNLASLIFCMPEYNGFVKLGEFNESLKSMTPAQIRCQICGALNTPGLDAEKSEITAEEFSKHIEALAIPLERKWDIIDVYKHFTEYADELYGIVQPVINHIKEQSALYRPLLEDFTKTYSSVPHIEKFLNDTFNIDVSDELMLELHPSIIGFNTLYLTKAANSDSSKLFIGVFMQRLVEINSHDETVAAIANITKALSDPGRLEILCYLRDNTAYGQELSERFKLSGTTIWHHMNRLQSSGFVNSAFGGNRTYYVMDKDRVRSYIEKLKWLLLNEK